MFSRAKRFSYPEPEGPTPTCERCLKHNLNFTPKSHDHTATFHRNGWSRRTTTRKSRRSEGQEGHDRIISHLQEMVTVRRQLSDEGIESCGSSSPGNGATVDEVEERLDLVIVPDQDQEVQGRAGPREHQVLVELCSELVTELAEGFPQKRSKRSWKKTRLFFKRVAAPMRKLRGIFRKQN